MPRRALRTAAVIGGTKHIASKAGAKAGAEQAAQQPAAAQESQPGPPAAQQPEASAQPVPAVPSTAPEESVDAKMDRLAKLKQLLDMGALTQDEFDAQKATILASM